MYHALLTHPQVSELQVELPLGVVRPDISFCWDGEVMVAVELQRSTLPPADVARRTSLYEEKGIAVLWVSLPRNRFNPGERCSTRVWERFLHELYDGKIFCWSGGQVLLATRLDPYILRTEYRERHNRYTGTWDFKEIQHFSKRSRIPHWVLADKAIRASLFYCSGSVCQSVCRNGIWSCGNCPANSTANRLSVGERMDTSDAFL